jgi:hypothetical protein
LPSADFYLRDPPLDPFREQVDAGEELGAPGRAFVEAALDDPDLDPAPLAVVGEERPPESPKQAPALNLGKSTAQTRPQSPSHLAPSTFVLAQTSALVKPTCSK